MEKAFKLSKDSKLYIDFQKYIKNCNLQKQYVKDFFKKNGIETTEYYVGGNGSVNEPFSEFEKKQIRLGLANASTNDKNKFKGMLLKEDMNSISLFRINSKVNKEFQDFAIEKQMIINIWQPDMRKYFKSLQWHGYTLSIAIDKEDFWYIKLGSNMLQNDDIPDGLEEIKISEFYQIKESRNK